MKSLLPVFVSLIGFFILLLIYYVFIYQKPETPFDVFLRLIRHNQETILAFTYKKIGPNEYLNYYVDDLQLEPRIEKFPVTFDSLPVNTEKLHGIISNTTNGFLVSGIEFPFRCPSGWKYDETNGKCNLEEICQPYDIDVFKGISYYQFNETFKSKLNANTTFHPRLFVDCNTNERKHCAPNELYVGGEVISNAYEPCEPYDVCQDMLTMTTHNFPIFVGDELDQNEFYICQNGRSVRRRCPNNTQFSRTQNACLPVSRCFDRQDNTTIYTGDSNQFILCLNGQENVVRCGNGVFHDPDTGNVECVNAICLNPRVTFQRFNDRINIPIGRQFCATGTNTPNSFTCNISTTLHKDNVQHLINDASAFPTTDEPHDRFDAFEIPDTTFDPQTNTCVPFAFDTNLVEMGTHNDILPSVPINLDTLEITYSGPEPFYYKNYNKIMHYPENSILIAPGKYANFTTIPDLDALEYIDEVKTATGGSDGVNYLISGPMTKGLLSTTSIYKNPEGATDLQGRVWNVYTQTFTNLYDAHSPFALIDIANEFSDTTYTFKYRIMYALLHVLTPYGFCSFEFELKNGATVLEDGTLNVSGMPNYIEMETVLAGRNDTMIVSDIYDKHYNPKHRPYFLEYVNVLKVVSPEVAKQTALEKFFEVDSKQLFKSDTIWN